MDAVRLLRRQLPLRAMMVICAGAGLAFGTARPLEAQSSERGLAIRSAFLFNFARFTEWPADSRELRLCVLGDRALAEAVRTLDGRSANDRVIRTRPIPDVQAARDCEMVFVGSQQDPLEVTRYLRGRNVLTVGEGPDFLSRGGMIQLRLVENRMTIDVGVAAVRASSIRLKAQLLSLSNLVQTRETSAP